ncbi:MAG: NgoFVII family restriction endonuclease [Candidatus Woesearchaeota archaeon]|nr:NgoFVII family restriction endonuclease [Candidatus Woesearchaeota archaeon]
MKYHIISRKKERMSVYETSMDLIDILKINCIKESGNAISFKDSKNEYSFNTSKSTLYKRFSLNKPLFEISVKILEDPFAVLENQFSEIKKVYFKEAKQMPYVILPLYSRTKKAKSVHEKSGLNQWNASGRPRDFNEIYIPIPIWIHKRFPGFFPPRDNSFNLILPDGKILDAKICQDNSKALMTNPNSALGEWLLRDVLNLKRKQLLTYKKLQTIGLDSVILEKKDNDAYLIDFRPSDTYEKFMQENK